MKGALGPLGAPQLGPKEKEANLLERTLVLVQNITILKHFQRKLFAVRIFESKDFLAP